MTRIEIQDLAAHELTADEQRDIVGGWFAIAGLFRYLQPQTKTFSDQEMLMMLATSQEA